MADIIQLLPDAIANQIAAGEVVQRPASALKELLENAIDAQAGHIKVIIEGGGKKLIQVIDDGTGMTETDARMAFERHATSKIRLAEDLGHITSLGFRGEALASIAAIAQVEIKTRHSVRDLGTRIRIQGTDTIRQEPCAHPVGTSISIKNLFFNTPARRRFLKSDALEMKHIIDEFYRAALAHPEIAFSLHHNGRELYRLTSGKLRQRIRYLFKRKKDEAKWMAIEEDTEVVRISGYIGKPEFARKNRSEQYFFVNNRFIKSSYLHHAVQNAYANLLPANHHPAYIIFLQLDPATIDVNVHPTKHEIKFEDERLIYRYLHVSVRHALGRFNISPTLNFDPTAQILNKPSTSPPISDRRQEAINLDEWRKAFEGIDQFTIPQDQPSDSTPEQSPLFGQQPTQDNPLNGFQIFNSYLLAQIKSGLVIIDQKAAHERILYEKLLNTQSDTAQTQQLLFPITLKSLDAHDELIKNNIALLRDLGYDLEEFGYGTFILRGIPESIASQQYTELQIEEDLLDLFDSLSSEKSKSADLKEKLLLKLAKRRAMPTDKKLHPAEINELISSLFKCDMPYERPGGGYTLITLEQDELQKRFKQ